MRIFSSKEMNSFRAIRPLSSSLPASVMADRYPVTSALGICFTGLPLRLVIAAAGTVFGVPVCIEDFPTDRAGVFVFLTLAELFRMHPPPFGSASIGAELFLSWRILPKGLFAALALFCNCSRFHPLKMHFDGAQSKPCFLRNLLIGAALPAQLRYLLFLFTGHASSSSHGKE